MRSFTAITTMRKRRFLLAVSWLSGLWKTVSSSREGINAYAAQHPEQTITVEYGQDSINNGMTLDDVIRTLNVEIFAGEGPDVLVLDGLLIESYIDQGILADLSQVDTDDCYKTL